MTESVSEVSNVDADGDDLMPFRLRDMKLKFNASNIHPIFDPIDEVRKQIKFITLLAYTELTKNRSIMLAFGILGFFLGSVNGNVISGGDSTTSGMDGLMEVGSFPFFQMLISIVCWVVFLYYLWMEFPVMRTHSIILVLIWNGITLANILFHQNNKNFPSDIVLAESMYGTLIMLVVIFSLTFSGRQLATRETCTFKFIMSMKMSELWKQKCMNIHFVDGALCCLFGSQPHLFQRGQEFILSQQETQSSLAILSLI